MRGLGSLENWMIAGELPSISSVLTITTMPAFFSLLELSRCSLRGPLAGDANTRVRIKLKAVRGAGRGLEKRRQALCARELR